MEQYNLKQHGDSRQREFADLINRRCPNFEPFWRAHIVPLSFRALEPENYFIRPQLKKQFVELADSSYGVFMHLVGALRWSETLLSLQRNEKWKPTDAAYYFFSHVYSLLEATGSLADAVNRVLDKMGADELFVVERPTEQSSWKIEYTGGSDVGRHWRSLQRMAKPYRNCLVHDKPLIFQNGLMPIARQDAIRALSGLTAISRLAMKDASILPQSEKVSDQIPRIVDTACELVDRLFLEAAENLDALDRARYDDARKPTPAEKQLTLKKILKAREL